MLSTEKIKHIYIRKKPKERNIHQTTEGKQKKHIENYKRNPILEHEGGEREEDFFMTKKYTNFVAFCSRDLESLSLILFMVQY